VLDSDLRSPWQHNERYCVSTESGVVGYLTVKPGQHMTEIDVPPDLLDSLRSERRHECLADLIKNYRVDLESTKSRLTKKT
jgi:hypothetical protein